MTSQSAGASDAINADDRVIADSADTDGVTGDNVSTDSVSVHPKRRSMALAIDGDVPQDSEDVRHLSDSSNCLSSWRTLLRYVRHEPSVCRLSSVCNVVAPFCMVPLQCL